MTVYDYRCRTCDTQFEVRRRMTEQAPAVRCPDGHDDVARIWSAVAMVGSSTATMRAPARPAATGGCCGGGCCG